MAEELTEKEREARSKVCCVRFPAAYHNPTGLPEPLLPGSWDALFQVIWKRQYFDGPEKRGFPMAKKRCEFCWERCVALEMMRPEATGHNSVTLVPDDMCWQCHKDEGLPYEAVHWYFAPRLEKQVEMFATEPGTPSPVPPLYEPWTLRFSAAFDDILGWSTLQKAYVPIKTFNLVCAQQVHVAPPFELYPPTGRKASKAPPAPRKPRAKK